MIASFKCSRTIRFAETDASGFVSISGLARIMEETEYAFLRSRNLCVVLDDERGIIGFPRISVQIEIQSPLEFDDVIETELKLVQVDGKKIVYEFVILREFESAATGCFVAACCRFPDRDLPYAILTPDFVIDRLSDPELENETEINERTTI